MLIWWWVENNFFFRIRLVYLDGMKFIFRTWNVERPFSKIGQFVKVKLPVTTSFRFFSGCHATHHVIHRLSCGVVSWHYMKFCCDTDNRNFLKLRAQSQWRFHTSWVCFPWSTGGKPSSRTPWEWFPRSSFTNSRGMFPIAYVP